jgi:hypothetical protein
MAGKLYLQNPPNNGVLVERGSLGITITGANGFDIGGRSNVGYALLSGMGATNLYTINPNSGMAANPKAFAPVEVKGFAVAPGF